MHYSEKDLCCTYVTLLKYNIWLLRDHKKYEQRTPRTRGSILEENEA